MASQWNMSNSTAFGNSSNTTRPRRNGGLSALTNIDVSLFTLSSLLSVFIVFGNTLVLSAFKANRRLRITPNYFIFSLAVADLFNGLISIPLYVTLSVTRDIYNPRLPMVRVYGAFDIICGTSSILNLTCISLERAYALLRPLQHRYLNKGIIVLGITCSWSLAGLAGMAQTKSVVEVPFYGFTVTVVYFMFPLIIITVAYAIIFKVARAHVRGRGRRSFKKDLRIAMTVAMVTGLFILFWGPFFATNSFFALCQYLDPSYSLCLSYPRDFSGFFKLLQCGSSACNPVIYGFRNRDFRRAFHIMFMRLICRKIPLTHFSSSTITHTTRRRVLDRQDSSFTDSRTTIYRGESCGSLAYTFDYRASYKKAISKGCKRPKRSLKDGILSISTEAFFVPSNLQSIEPFTTSSSVSGINRKEISLDCEQCVILSPDGSLGKNALDGSIINEQFLPNVSEQESRNLTSKPLESCSECVFDNSSTQSPQNDSNFEKEGFSQDSTLSGGTFTCDGHDSKPRRSTLLKDLGKNRVQAHSKVISRERVKLAKHERKEAKKSKSVLHHDNKGFVDFEGDSDATKNPFKPSSKTLDGEDVQQSHENND